MADIQSTEKSRELFDRAARVVPGGVNSPVRAFRSVGGDPRFMVSGEGCRMTDADGNTYVDLVSSWGPLILGHAHPHVIDAVTTAAAKGTSFGTPTPGEVALAEELTARTGVDKIRLVNSGTEATMSALRLARAATGRTKIIKFAGCYHGHVDPLLAAAGSGVATLALPDSPGVVGTDETIVVAYNDIDAVAKTFAEYEGQIACVITEAAAGNMGVVAPRDGFNRKLAELCRANGALLILDEVMTGFRVSKNGWAGIERWTRATGEDERAQASMAATVQPRGSSGADGPDLFTYGKVMGGGLPAAAFGGRSELMDMLAPSGPVYQAGTLSGNPLACAAGLATLQLCDDALYAKLDAVSQTLGEAATAALTEAGVPHRLSRAGNMFSVFFTADDVWDFTGAQGQNIAAYRAFFHEMLAKGVYLPPSAYEAWFVSGALDDAAVSQISDALPYAARAAAKVAR